MQSDKMPTMCEVEQKHECLSWALWSCLVLVDGFIKTGCLLFELCWTDITKKTMSPFSVVKYLDVPEQIGPCFFTSSITNTVHSLAFK